MALSALSWTLTFTWSRLTLLVLCVAVLVASDVIRVETAAVHGSARGTKSERSEERAQSAAMTRKTLVFQITEASELEDYATRRASGERGGVARAAAMATARASLPEPKRVFRDANVFEPKHRRVGLHLIFETSVEVDTDDDTDERALVNAMTRLRADENVVRVAVRSEAVLFDDAEDEEVLDFDEELMDAGVVRINTHTHTHTHTRTHTHL